MLATPRMPKSRGLMALWKLTAFEDVPADFPQLLADIVRAYPYPGTAPAKTPVKAAASE